MQFGNCLQFGNHQVQTVVECGCQENSLMGEHLARFERMAGVDNQSNQLLKG